MAKAIAGKVSTKWIEPGISKSSEGDALAIDGVDHVEIIAANGRQAAHYYCSAFGFSPVAYRGPETGHREAASYVLRQNQITLVITSALRINSWMSSFNHLHGDSVRCAALLVPDCERFYYEAMKRGARSAEVPTLYEDEFGTIKRAAICTYGDVLHPIIERNNYKGLFAPGFVPYESLFPVTDFGGPIGLKLIDHMVGNVHHMDEWVDFYQNTLGFSQLQHFSDEDISTEYSALMSKVVQSGEGKIKFPINEPATGRRKSQIEEYLDFHNGPGVQHLALQTDNIIETIKAMRNRGVDFLKIPPTYYQALEARVGKIEEDVKEVARLGILVDRDEEGYLLQLFTRPVHDRPTLFFEVIQRHGSKGFGIGNFKALFEAIEREQEMRGNL